MQPKGNASCGGFLALLTLCAGFYLSYRLLLAILRSPLGQVLQWVVVGGMLLTMLFILTAGVISYFTAKDEKQQSAESEDDESWMYRSRPHTW
jgi:hypothetical protein